MPTPLDDVVDLRSPVTDEICETHGARVHLRGDRAYKVRKPVRFAFLDQSTYAQRLRLSCTEVAINQTLAPTVYLGVRGVTTPEGTQDIAVEMRRFDGADTLVRRLQDGRVTAAMLTAIGTRLARFHAAAQLVPGGGLGSVLRRLDRNAEELAALVGPHLSPADVWSVMRPLQAFAWREHRMLAERALAGAWRDGHGDLRAEHVVLEASGLQIVDRLEFDADLRADDVSADLAFLEMDLEFLGHPEAALAIRSAYRAAGGDPGSDALLGFWAAYRATVRLKVALLRGSQPGGAQALTQVAPLLALAARLVWRTRTPELIAVCGPPASGKSTLAAALAARTGWPIVSSDVMRKHAQSLDPTDRAPQAAYTDAVSDRLYADLGAAAVTARASSRGVIVDATMGRADRRRRFVAATGGAAVLFVTCSAPTEELVRRAEARMHDPRRVSDATPEVAKRLRAAWEPLDEIDAEHQLTVRTDRAADRAVDALERSLDGVDAARGTSVEDMP